MSDLTNLYVSEFYGMEVICVTSESLGTLVVAKPLSDSLGLNWDKQRERLNRSPVFNPVVIKGSDIISSIYSSPTDLYAGINILPGANYLCIPESDLGLWICSITDSKTSKHAREIIFKCKYLISKDLKCSTLPDPVRR